MRILAADLNAQQTYKLLTGVVVPTADRLDLLALAGRRAQPRAVQRLHLRLEQAADARRERRTQGGRAQGHRPQHPRQRRIRRPHRRRVAGAGDPRERASSTRPRSAKSSCWACRRRRASASRCRASPRRRCAMECRLHRVDPVRRHRRGIHRRRGAGVPSPRRPAARRQDRHAPCSNPLCRLAGPNYATPRPRRSRCGRSRRPTSWP